MSQDAGGELEEVSGRERAVGWVAEGAAAGEMVKELVGQAGGVERPEEALQLAELDLTAVVGGRGGTRYEGMESRGERLMRGVGGGCMYLEDAGEM
jgi:hypothetical protein